MLPLSIYEILDSKVLSLWMPMHPFPNHVFLSKLLHNFEYLGTKRVKIRRKGKEEIDDQKKKKGQTNTKHPEETPERPFLMFLILPFFPLSLQVLLLFNKHLSSIFTMETQCTDESVS